MATVGVTFFRASTIEESAACIEAQDMVSQVITSSGTSQASTATATASRNYVRIGTSANVYLAFGTAPTAVTATGYLLLAGTSEVFRVPDGWKVAVID